MTKNFDGEIKGVLIDLDGVLYLNQLVIPGAREAVRAIRSSGMPFRFVTNTTRMNRETIAEYLRSIGIPAEPGEIISPPIAAAAYMTQIGVSRFHLLAPDDLMGAFGGHRAVDEAAEVVVIGDLGNIFTFDRLNNAFRLIMEGAEMLALHKDRFWLTESGPRLDTGAFVAALEYSSGKKATVVGKPERPFFEIALLDLDLPADSVAMVGDSIETDIGGAQNLGITGILVKTGNYQYHNEKHSPVIPDITIESIADLPHRIL